MKRILAIGLTVLLGIFAVVQLHAYRAAAAHRLSAVKSSSSQIFIHGTPVCVFRLGENIVARICECPESPGLESDTSMEKAPFSGNPVMELPPGHPPVNRDGFPDVPRRIPI